MCSGIKKTQYEFIIFIPPYKQPIGLNMAIVPTFIVAMQGMVGITFRQRFACHEKFQHLLKLLYIKTTLYTFLI